MRLFALYATSIIAGFCMMALEIMGGRVLYPVFGSSIDVWAAIISVFILSLSVGYVIGGRLADRISSNAVLGWVLVAAGIAYCILPVIALPLQTGLGRNIQQAQWGSLVAALILFLAPSLLLGAVSPMLVRLVFVSAERVGRTTGTLYAVGSIGNVLGVLVSDYALMKWFDNNTNIWVMGVVLIAVGVAHLARRMDATSPEAARAAAATAGAAA
jgi:MFS family permease